MICLNTLQKDVDSQRRLNEDRKIICEKQKSQIELLKEELGDKANEICILCNDYFKSFNR